MLVRSWNLFHGNTSPPIRRAYLEEMVRLATADGPDVLFLQELPRGRSPPGEWSGMRVVADIARRRRLPLPLGRRLTTLHSGLFRSPFSGQANAILLRHELAVQERSVFVLNRSRLLGTGAGERRICQIVRVSRRGASWSRTCTPRIRRDRRRSRSRTRRALLELARPGDTVVIAGDFNFTPDSVLAASPARDQGSTTSSSGATTRDRSSFGPTSVAA